MRCPDCAKMVSYGDAEVEMQSEDFEFGLTDEEPVQIQVQSQPDVRLMLPCGDCGTELKEATFTLEFDIQHRCKEMDGVSKEKLQEAVGGLELSFEPEATDRRDMTDAKGKPIKFRYQKQYYGAAVTASFTCPFCGKSVDEQQSDEVQASGMDELV